MSVRDIRARDPKAEADERQHRAADPGASVWVSASAGTGKTKVLTDRVLSLLVTGTAPQRILCLTFTRAAAAEMANRINRALGKWATLPEGELVGQIAELLGRVPDRDTLRRARALFARVLDTPGGMKIQTIHAFCESLLGRFPLEAHLAPHFQLMDDRSAAEAMEEARAALILHAESGVDPALKDALAELAARVSEERFADLLDKLLHEHQKLRRLTAAGVDHAISRIFDRLGVDPKETEESILAEFCANGACDEAALRKACTSLGGGNDNDQKRAGLIAAWLDSGAGRAAGFESYRSIFLTNEGKARAIGYLMTKKPRDADPASATALLAEADRVIEFCRRRNAAITARATAALLRLGSGVLDEYDAHKRATGALDYDDLIIRARDLLRADGGASWVLYKLDGGIDHILIDEAQDTNPEQWEIVAALAEEFFAGEGARQVGAGGARTVFAVGDAKQSIYGFQRADPAAFERMRAHFRDRVRAARAAWDDVDLHVSFRSTGSVLSAVDAVFARALARDGVARADETIEHLPFRTGQAGLVELWPPVAPRERAAREPWTPPVERREGDAPAARLAQALARLIHRWLAEGEMLLSRGRAVRPGDVMVLVRRRGPFVDELVRSLKQHDVPVAGVDRMVLDQQLAVKDLIALGHMLLLPEDDLTLAIVLKSPLVGIDEPSLYDLAQPRERGETLWAALRRRAHERADWRDAYESLSALLARADFVPPYELYAGLLGRSGGRRRILGRLGHEAADPIDEFLGRAIEFERDHPPSLQLFLHWLALGGVEVKRDLEQATRDEVRVMTVHGSKGLQAPIVFLPDTLQTPLGNDDVLLWTEDGLVLWPPRAAYREKIAQAALGEAARKREQEYRRLLYVAMTRAEDRLYICGWHGRRKPPAGNWHELVETGLKAASLGGPVTVDLGDGQAGDGQAGEERGEGLRLDNPQNAPSEKPERAGLRLPPPTALPPWALAPAPPEEVPPRPLAPSRPAEDEPAPRSPLGDDRGAMFRRGILVHRLLQALPEIAPDARADAVRRFLARKAHGLAPEAQEALAAEVLAVVEAPAHAALFGPGSRAEVPVVGRIGAHVVSGQVDRLVVAGGTVRVVDYKTNRPPPSSPGDVPSLYLRQMAAYRAVLRLVYPGNRIECALLWTDGPSLMALPDDLLDRWAP